MHSMVCTLLAAVGLPWAVSAAIAVGENILLNPELDKDQSELPLGWTVPDDKPIPHIVPDFAPGKATAFLFKGADMASGTTVRQMDMELVPGGRYRLRFKAKTSCFRGGIARCVVADAGWNSDAGIRVFPEDSGWTDYSLDFECMPRIKKADGRDRYQFIISVGGRFAGEIAFSNLSLEALDRFAADGTQRMRLPEAVTRPRIIPLSPFLHRIRRDESKISVAFCNFGKDCASDLSIRYSVGESTQTVPFAEERTFDLMDAPERGTIAFTVCRSADGAEVARREFAYGKIDVPVADVRVERRLNNFVSELVSARTGSSEKESYEFSLAKGGWVFLRFAADSGLKPGAGFAIRTAGRTLVDSSVPGLETVRYLSAGKYVLDVSSAAPGTLFVRSIGEIYYYSPMTESKVGNMPKRTWERFVADVLPNVTTLGGVKNLDEFRTAYVRSAGRRTQMFFATSSFKTAGEFDRALRTSPAMTSGLYDAAMVDEQFFDRPEHLDLCTEALWRYSREFPNAERLISAACVGNPASGPLDVDFLSAVANSSGGRGELAVEAYYRTKPTEEEAAREILTKYGKTVSEIRKANPNVAGNILLLLGIFVQQPVLSLVHHPEVDYRYYLDMQMRAAATDPVFDGIKGVGVWGSGYADEELHKWTLKLLRHYFIEGQTTLLSEKYGLKYLPGFVANGDFRENLDGWETSGNVRQARIAKLGRDILNRWWAPGGLGDAYAEFSGGKEPARARQVLKGLEPGRVYQLEFASFDPREVKAKKTLRRRHAIRGTMGRGARTLEENCWTWVDDRPNRKGGVFGFVNLHHLVFVAESDEAEFSIDNAGAAEGDIVGVNSVAVRLALSEKVNNCAK